MTLKTNEEIAHFLEGYEKEAKALKQEILKLCWYMRGGLTYSEAMDIGLEERKIIADLIKENVETTKKTGLPIF